MDIMGWGFVLFVCLIIFALFEDRHHIKEKPIGFMLLFLFFASYVPCCMSVLDQEAADREYRRQAKIFLEEKYQQKNQQEQENFQKIPELWDQK